MFIICVPPDHGKVRSNRLATGNLLPGTTCLRVESSATKLAPLPFLAREVGRRVVRHPDGSKNKICQRAPVLESTVAAI